MEQAEKLAKLIINLCDGCLIYSVCSSPCFELYKKLEDNGVTIPPNLPSPVILGHTVSRIVKEWRLVWTAKNQLDGKRDLADIL